MEGVRSSTIAAALLFLTLLVLSAAASGGDDDAAAAAAAVEQEKRCHPRADEPYMLVAFHNKDGEEVRLLADQRNAQLSGVSAFANRSGHWFYSPIRGRAEGKRRRLFPLPQPNNNRSRGGSRSTAEGLWNTLGVVVNSTEASGDPGAAADDDDERYMVVGMQTSGGDKIRLVVVADQRYFFITGYAKRFLLPPNWFFRDGERHRLLPSLGSGTSHAEVVASSVLGALMKGGKACSASQSYSPEPEE